MVLVRLSCCVFRNSGISGMISVEIVRKDEGFCEAIGGWTGWLSVAGRKRNKMVTMFWSEILGSGWRGPKKISVMCVVHLTTIASV